MVEHDFDLMVGACRKCGLPVLDWRKGAEECPYPAGVVSISYLHYRNVLHRQLTFAALVDGESA